MRDVIFHIDTDLLLAINRHHAEWVDTLMWLVSAKATWLPLYVLLVGGIAWRYRSEWRTMLVVLLAVVVAVGLTDWVTHALKYWIARPRPSHVPELEGLLHIVNDYRGGQYGHPSNHAADTMALAVLACSVLRRWPWTILMTVFVALNCYSRMYLGVHYPLDILMGLMIGGTISGIIYWNVVRKYS